MPAYSLLVTRRIGNQVEELLDEELERPISIGRQDSGEPSPIQAGRHVPRLVRGKTEDRLILVPLHVVEVPRWACRCEPGEMGLRVTVGRNPLVTERGPLFPNSPCELSELTCYFAGMKSQPDLNLTLSIRPVEEVVGVLAEQTQAPSLLPDSGTRPVDQSLRQFLFPTLGSPTPPPDAYSLLTKSLEMANRIMLAVAKGEGFEMKAAQEVAELMCLDYASVLAWKGHEWRPDYETRPRNAAGAGIRLSERLLGRMRLEKKAAWKQPGGQESTSLRSLSLHEGALAAPILDTDGSVIGALYGYRSAANPAGPFSESDAHIVELVARMVASGKAVRKAVSLQQRFEQFFSRKVADLVQSDPKLLDGRACDATMLFCDIRRFSSISQRLSPERLTLWLQAVMDELAHCVHKYEGVVVDFVGDEIVAMWGAPHAQPDHALLACRAALEMRTRLGPLNDKWSQELGDDMDFGVGVNSGSIKAGNIGSTNRLKYGPLGSPVNLASRVQGVTKQLRCPILITRETERRLTPDARKEIEPRLRRVCTVRVVNIDEDVELLELNSESDEPRGRRTFAGLRAFYDEGLAAFEAQQFRSAAAHLMKGIELCPDDGPSLVLLQRVVPYVVDPPPPGKFSPVWVLTSK